MRLSNEKNNHHYPVHCSIRNCPGCSNQFNPRNQKPKSLTLEMLESADRVITMGCSVAEVCPASFVPTEDWELDDPEGKSIEEIRQIRDQIKTKVEVLVKELDTT